MPKCAFLTIANRDGWFIDDDLVHAPLTAKGWEVMNVPWKSAADWNAFDVVVIRSTWDYQGDLARFRSVLREIERSQATLLNPWSTVEWNVDKKYLFDLERDGIEIVPTLCTDIKNIGDIRQTHRHFASEQIVIKPTVSANADHTFRVSYDSSESELSRICEALKTRECLVQPFMTGITSEGEYSLMYIDGCYTHCVLKKTRMGDFRVQEEHGGQVGAVHNPDPNSIAVADRIVDSLEEPPLYARVDLVRTKKGSFALMELELIEPCLYLRFDEQTPARFANAIDKRFADD